MVAILSAMACLAPRPLAADVFVLTHGGRITGEWVNPQKSAADDYQIETPEGIQLRLPSSDVQRIIAADPRREAYRQRASTCADSVAEHWQIAEWCRQRQLDRERADHLARILESEPDHAGARYGLGYSQVRGQWVMQDEIQQRRGYQRHAGRWRTEQEIQLLRIAQTRTTAERNWLTQLRRWRRTLGTPDGREAYRQIAAVRDPAAVPGLAELLQEEMFRQAKWLYIETLAAIGNADAIDVLYQVSLKDPDEEIFHACLDALVKRNPPGLAVCYVKVLQENDNVRLNRAAHALGRLEDRSVLSPLIDALVTTHTIVLPERPRGYHATFRNPISTGGIPAPFPGHAPTGNSGLSAGSEATTIPWTVSNQEVLQALIQLSHGANFGFDQTAWRFWLASETRRNTPEVNRRGD
jgi:hypothetical protein